MTCLVANTEDERLFKALTGVSRQEFQELRDVFAESEAQLREDAYNANAETRRRKPGGGSQGHFKTAAATLYFLL